MADDVTPLHIQTKTQLKDKERREISERRQVGDTETLVHPGSSASGLHRRDNSEL